MSQPSIHPYPLVQEEFNRMLRFTSVKSVPFLKAVKVESDWTCKSLFLSLFPIFAWLPQYDCKADLLSDLVVGFTVAVMHVPQGMAYATLSEVNPIVGIYMAVFPTLPYVIMGTSKHISLGSFSITCIMAAKPIMALSNAKNATERSINYSDMKHDYSPIEVAKVLCISVGVFQVLLGVLKAGFLSVFLSKPIISGFTTGAAVLVLNSQLTHVFGIKLHPHYGLFGALHNVAELIKRVSETNFISLSMSITVILCLLVCSDLIEPWLKWKFKLPMELIVLIFGALISHWFDLETQCNVHVVGHIPTGFPDVTMPHLPIMMNVQFLFESMAIATVCFAISLSMATIFATKDNYKIDPNQELFAYGAGNIFGGFFPCVPMAASLSRSTIQYNAGGKTQLVTIFSTILLLFTMVFIGEFLHPLPYCVLAGIVIKNLKGMLLLVTELPTLYRQSLTDGVTWSIVFISVILLDIISGLVIALILAILSIVLMNQKTYVCLLGRVPKTDLYLEMRRFQAAKPLPGMLIVQIYAGLHFANINVCLNRIEHLLKKTSKNEDVDCVILGFSGVLFVDPEALDKLTVFINQLHERHIQVCLAECTGRVLEQMDRCKFFDKFPGDVFFPSIHYAVLYCQQLNVNDLHKLSISFERNIL